MYLLIKHKKSLIKIIGFLLIFHTTLFADFSFVEATSPVEKVYIAEISTDESVIKKSEIPLDSFGGMSVTIVLILTSFLGAFFVREEFGNI